MITNTDCRTEAGITVGLVDAIITAARVLVARDLSPSAVREALADLRQDEDVAALLAAEAAVSAACKEEVWSWDHFRDSQVDGYWIRCSLTGPHLEHEDSHTGLTWPALVTA